MSDMKLNVKAIRLFLIGFVSLMALGVLIVMNQDQSVGEQVQQANLRTTERLNASGQQKCKKAVKKVVGGNVYSATRVESDQSTYLDLYWDKGVGDNKTAHCKFVVGKGIVQLEVDGESVISKQ